MPARFDGNSNLPSLCLLFLFFFSPSPLTIYLFLSPGTGSTFASEHFRCSSSGRLGAHSGRLEHIYGHLKQHWVISRPPSHYGIIPQPTRGIGWTGFFTPDMCPAVSHFFVFIFAFHFILYCEGLCYCKNHRFSTVATTVLPGPPKNLDSVHHPCISSTPVTLLHHLTPCMLSVGVWVWGDAGVPLMVG